MQFTKAMIRTFCIAAALLVANINVAAESSRAPRTFGTSGQPLRYVVLGDSTAAGVGADYEAGIAVGTARELGQRHVVTMNNFAVSGARMDDVLRLQLPAAEALRPDVVLLSAGANDVTHLTRIGKMQDALQAIVQRLRAANPAVKIVVTGSPDMGSPPRVPWLLRGLASCRTKQVNRMFEREVAQSNLVFAPIATRTGPLFRRDRTLFHPDRFHPNERGYATWIPVLNEALAKAIS
ncbi:MAG TPA: SGNH/GDSL hydrolase family protein [Thermoanaerobaculia bacterium]|nr:SGNH/GDSL hydrolase family protein [Thermoanaerobaculia bacterium]